MSTALRVRSAADLTPPQKVAALMIAIGAKGASQLMSHLDDAEVEAVTTEIVRLRDLPKSVLGEIVADLQRAAEAGGVFRGGPEYARELLMESRGPSGSQLLDRILSDRPPFAFLQDAPPAAVLAALDGEHPQTIALVVSELGSAQAAGVVSSLPPDVRVDVARRLATVTPPPPDVLALVEDAVRERFEARRGGPAPDEASGPRELAAILNALDKAAAQELLAALEAADPALAEIVRIQMFVFEDIAGLRPRDIQEILRRVDASSLAMALKGTDSGLRDAILQNMSERARESVLEEMDALGGVRRPDVEDARRSVVSVVRAMEQEGKIVLGGEGEGALLE